MAESHVPAMREVYEYWERGEYPVLDIYSPDIEFVISDEFPQPGTWHGIEGMREGFVGWLEGWTNFCISAERFIDGGDTVVVFVRYTGLGRTSRVPMDQPGAMLWRFVDGLSVRQEIRIDRERALEAAGLSG